VFEDQLLLVVGVEHDGILVEGAVLRKVSWIFCAGLVSIADLLTVDRKVPTVRSVLSLLFATAVGAATRMGVKRQRSPRLNLCNAGKQR